MARLAFVFICNCVVFTFLLSSLLLSLIPKIHLISGVKLLIEMHKDYKFCLNLEAGYDMPQEDHMPEINVLFPRRCNLSKDLIIQLRYLKDLHV